MQNRYHVTYINLSVPSLTLCTFSGKYNKITIFADIQRKICLTKMYHQRQTYYVERILLRFEKVSFINLSKLSENPAFHLSIDFLQNVMKLTNYIAIFMHCVGATLKIKLNEDMQSAFVTIYLVEVS